MGNNEGRQRIRGPRKGERGKRLRQNVGGGEKIPEIIRTKST